MGNKRRIYAAVGLAALLLLGACSGDDAPPAPEAVASASPAPEAKCPLTGADAPNGVDLEQPAVAVKVENNPIAYPLSGLEDAELVYEEQVEGAVTRFMAVFHCTDTAKIGPVRSSREVDPAIMTPTTRILAAAGGNDIVRAVLKKADIVIVDENTAGGAMRRVDRPGIATEHTLYGNTVKLRAVGKKEYDTPPPEDLFKFGEAMAGGKKVKAVELTFGTVTTVEYRWAGGRWKRFDKGEPLVDESGKQIEVDNVIIEQHVLNNSKTVFDVAGNPSVEIADVVGKGDAILFRDGKAYVGRWVRKSRNQKVVYQTKQGEEMALKPGVTWVELLPNQKGELKGSFKLKR